uniref:leukocyte receptor cluster member 1 homolog n=1 Tax=Styela clava TaxID=7725 RepID=UPI001939B1B3|nr:leukocyte receptor cluster member 1 homolog [Styela clava]
MNILPKKSWHVRNKDNVAKVRRDEENARLEEKEQNRRAALAEREARTKHLRDKARQRAIESGADFKQIEGSSKKSLVPTNFFTDSTLERGATSSIKNVEHEKEKKEEQVNYEKKIGLLTYLGQSAAETMEDSDKPWYFKTPKRYSDGKKGDSSIEDHQEADLKRKNSLDPIQAMQNHLQKKKLVESRKEKTKKKHKRKHKHQHFKKESVPRRSGSSNDKLAKLREERLKREKKERERTIALLNNGESNSSNNYNIERGRYNSQYNPHLVRQKYHSKY